MARVATRLHCHQAYVDSDIAPSGEHLETLADIASLASIFSSVAVVASLIYSALQVSQNTKHTRATIHQGRVARAVDLAVQKIAGSPFTRFVDDIIAEQATTAASSPKLP